MKILIVEEIPIRERFTFLLLKKKLIKKNHEVLICSTNNLVKESIKFKPDLVIDNVSTDIPHFIGKWFHLKQSQKNINLVWEQFINPRSFKRFIGKDDVRKEFVNETLVWGEGFKKYLNYVDTNSIDKVFVSGSLKYASSSYLKQFEKKEIEHILNINTDNYSKTILISDNFKSQHDNFNKNFKNNDINPFVEFSNHYAHDFFPRFISAISKIIKKNPNYLFIVRSHPSKSKDEHMDVFFNFPNVFFFNSGDISLSIKISDLVITSRSGVVLDSYFNDTDVINIIEKDHPVYFGGILQSLESKACKPESLLDLSTIDLENYKTTWNSKFIEFWISKTVDPFDFIIDRIENISKINDSKRVINNFTFRILIRICYNLAMRIFNSKSNKSKDNFDYSKLKL